MESEALHRFRNQKMGFIFQFNYLLAELTLLENVLMPTLKFKQREQFHPHALELLEQFSLKDKMNRRRNAPLIATVRCDSFACFGVPCRTAWNVHPGRRVPRFQLHHDA